MDPIESVEHNGVDDHGWKEVASRKKRHRKQKPNGADGNENLKAPEETEKRPDWEVSLAKAAAKIRPSDLADHMAKAPDILPGVLGFRLRRFINFYEHALDQVPCPWRGMLQESDLPDLLDMLHVPLSYIPEPVYKASVAWLDRELPDTKFRSGFILWAFHYIICDLYLARGGVIKDEHVLPGSYKPGDRCVSSVSIFVTLAILVRSKPLAFTRVMPSLWYRRHLHGEGRIPLTIWFIAQAYQDNLPAGLCSWVHILFPLFPENPQSTDPILKLVENILAKPDARTILVNAPVWDGMPLVPPQLFKTFLWLSFPVTSATNEFTSRFEEIYPVLKEVALASTSGTEAVKEIFTLSLELAGVEGNPGLAEEATAIAIWSLTEMADRWKYWESIYEESIYEEDLKGSVALLKEIVRQCKGSTLGSKAMIEQEQIFTFSLKLVGEAIRNNVLVKETTSIAIWSLSENINCWKHWDNLYKENLEASVALLKRLVKKCKDQAMFQQIFTFSLKLVGEVTGNHVLVKEATSIAIWSLNKNFNCWKHWDNLYKENIEASVALLKRLVEKCKDKAMIQQIFTFSFKLAKEGNTVVAEEATAIAIWSLTKNVDCCKLWDNLYKENLEVSVTLLKKLVDEWKDHSLKLSSSPSHTLTLTQTMKSFMLKNKKVITEREANASLYKEADRSCKVIYGRLTRLSSCLKCTTIAAVVLVATVALAAGAHVLSSNPYAIEELKNLVDEFKYS